MEAQEQKKIHVNPDFILAGGQSVKPKVHFNPAFFQKSAAAQKNRSAISYNPSAEGDHRLEPQKVKFNHDKYEAKEPIISGKLPQTKPFTNTVPQSSLVRLNHPPYKLLSKSLNIKSKLPYEKQNMGQHKYSSGKHNVYSHSSTQPGVKTTGALVKPPSAYSWTSQGSHSTPPLTVSPSKLTLQNHKEMFSKNNTLTCTSVRPAAPTLLSNFKFVRKESKAVLPSEVKGLYPHGKSKDVATSNQNIRKETNFHLKDVLNSTKSIKDVNIRGALKFKPSEKKMTVIRSQEGNNHGSRNHESSNILVNPKFLQKLTAKTSATTPTSVSHNLCNSQFHSTVKTSEVMSLLKEPRNTHKKNLSDGFRKERYRIVSKTKLVRQNSTPRSKPKGGSVKEGQEREVKSLSVPHYSPRMVGGVRIPKFQSPGVMYATNARMSGKRRFSIVSRTKLVRSNSGGSLASDKVSGKPKYSYKTKTKLVRSHSNQNVDDNRGLNKTKELKSETVKSDTERQKKFTILSKTKLVRRRSNSGSYKTKVVKSVYPNKKSIVKRHKLVRNASVLPHHHWLRKTPRDTRIKTPNNYYKVTNSNLKLSVNQKLARGIVSKYKINRLKSAPSETSHPSINKFSSDIRRKFKSAISREGTTKKRSDRFINIGGILYKSTKTTLRKQLTRSEPKTVRRPTECCTVLLRGERFHLAAGGRTLKRVEAGSGRSQATTPRLPRVHIGGLTYSRTRTGQYKLTTTHHARAFLSSARQRSLSTLLMQRRKKGSVQKRNQFCVFFNRFGRCTKKERGECPFIHDTKRVAVCTRFLRGRCPVKTCPFSHTIDPDKMPVCSHFLRSVCTRDPCPYRHVRVNPAAPICLDFVRGHCQSGTECKKQHVLICEEYESKGKCPRGASCPLSHHKGRNNYKLGPTRVTDEVPRKKVNYMYTLHRKRKMSESDVLGRPKSKKKVERGTKNLTSRVPQQRYFSVLVTDESKQEDRNKESCVTVAKKTSCGSSQTSSISSSIAPSTSQASDIHSTERKTADILTHSKQDNLTLLVASNKTDLEETRLRILEKVDKLKKSYSVHANPDLTKLNNEVKKHNDKECPMILTDTDISVVENSSKDKLISDGVNASTISNIVQRQPLPKRLPSFISLTMDEVTEDM